MLDAKFYVNRMSQENEELGRKLGEESRSAESAAESYMQRSSLSDELRSAELYQFKQCAIGLAQEYKRHSDANSLQVVQDRERGLQINTALRK